MSRQLILDKMQALMDVRTAIDAAKKSFGTAHNHHDVNIWDGLNSAKEEADRAIRWYAASDEFRNIPELDDIGKSNARANEYWQSVGGR